MEWGRFVTYLWNDPRTYYIPYLIWFECRLLCRIRKGVCVPQGRSNRRASFQLAAGQVSG